jgi:hypothetical protein
LTRSVVKNVAAWQYQKLLSEIDLTIKTPEMDNAREQLGEWNWIIGELENSLQEDLTAEARKAAGMSDQEFEEGCLAVGLEVSQARMLRDAVRRMAAEFDERDEVLKEVFG